MSTGDCNSAAVGVGRWRARAGRNPGRMRLAAGPGADAGRPPGAVSCRTGPPRGWSRRARSRRWSTGSRARRPGSHGRRAVRRRCTRHRPGRGTGRLAERRADRLPAARLRIPPVPAGVQGPVIGVRGAAGGMAGEEAAGERGVVSCGHVAGDAAGQDAVERAATGAAPVAQAPNAGWTGADKPPLDIDDNDIQKILANSYACRGRRDRGGRERRCGAGFAFRFSQLSIA